MIRKDECKYTLLNEVPEQFEDGYEEVSLQPFIEQGRHCEQLNVMGQSAKTLGQVGNCSMHKLENQGGMLGDLEEVFVRQDGRICSMVRMISKYHTLNEESYSCKVITAVSLLIFVLTFLFVVIQS